MLALSLVFIVAVVATTAAVLGISPPLAGVTIIMLVAVISLIVYVRNRFTARRALV
jgi:hypothetical protein